MGYQLELFGAVVSVVYSCGVLARKVRADGTSGWARFLNVMGFLSTTSLIFLGAIWPSLFTVLAILALPALVLFLVAAFRPRPRSALVRGYLLGAVVASGLSWIIEFWWEYLYLR